VRAHMRDREMMICQPSRDYDHHFPSQMFFYLGRKPVAIAKGLRWTSARWRGLAVDAASLIYRGLQGSAAQLHDFVQ
jgi:hypothetical protein